MSTKKLESVIYKELEKVNDRIDMKIIKGRPYKDEARRHRELLVQLQGMRTEKRINLGTRSHYGKGHSIMSRVWSIV